MFLQERKRRKAWANIEPNAVVKMQRIREAQVVQHEPELVRKLAVLEAEVRLRKRRDVVAWRRRSRVQWLVVGDATSHYFFAQMKAKKSLETIHCLVGDDGTVIEDETTIMEEIGREYAAIYALDSQVELFEEERQ